MFGLTVAQQPDAAEFMNVDNHRIISSKTQNDLSYMGLIKAEGSLRVQPPEGVEFVDTFEAYFPVPIPYEDQTVIFIEVSGHELIDYRFVRHNPPNILVAARFNACGFTGIFWTAWVLVKENWYGDLPPSVPIPTRDELPDSVLKFLQPTDCVQSDAPIVLQTAQEVKGSIDDLRTLAEEIYRYCLDIPWGNPWLPHDPVAFDAVYALTWGSTCTGHAHAAAALCRANGIPARVLLNILNNWHTKIDMHWCIQYFVPDYGWVKMDPNINSWMHKYSATHIVMLACNPEDEFPVFHANGIECAFHSSDPALLYHPDWRQSHKAKTYNVISASNDTLSYILEITNTVFSYYTKYYGIHLDAEDQDSFQLGLTHQEAAKIRIDAHDIDGYIADMHQALYHYRQIQTEPVTTIFFDDCENGPGGWTHGGFKDEWELGVPVSGPQKAHSGDHCWGTDLDNTYPKDADFWLMTRPIYLHNYRCAYLHFWLWNWVEEEDWNDFSDYLWMDITNDGSTFYPLCSGMRGVNDDPAIPDVGGWTMVALDLTRYVGDTVQIRFQFHSNGNQDVQHGSFIDDVHVFGIYESGVDTTQPEDPETPPEPPEPPLPETFIVHQNYPNPFNDVTNIRYELPSDSHVKLTIFNAAGRKVSTLIDDIQSAGVHSVIWNPRGLSSGLYFYTFSTDGFSEKLKLLYIK